MSCTQTRAGCGLVVRETISILIDLQYLLTIPKTKTLRNQIFVKVARQHVKRDTSPLAAPESDNLKSRRTSSPFPLQRNFRPGKMMTFVLTPFADATYKH